MREGKELGRDMRAPQSWSCERREISANGRKCILKDSIFRKAFINIMVCFQLSQWIFGNAGGISENKNYLL